MPPSKHATLSASAAQRWMACPPSVMATKDMPDTTSEYAEEGSAAHEVAEYKLRWNLGEKNISPPSTGKFDADEIDRYTDVYAYYVGDVFETLRKNCPDAILLIEQRLDFSDYVPDGFGTGDAVIIADDVMQICDLKYGKGIRVAADNNPQMMLYALGALNMYGCLYDIKTVRLAIIQPRLDNISEWEISVEDLYKWTETELKPKAQLAAKGEGEFSAGEHCRFCKLKATCRKRAERMLELTKYDFAPPAELTKTEIAAVMEIADDLAKWADDVFAYAQAQAINNGVHWDGYKIVEGRSNRKFTDEKKVADICREQGYQLSQIYKTTLIGITDMEKLMGKKRFREILSDFVTKPKGKLTLVPITDKREEVVTISDFKEEN